MTFFLRRTVLLFVSALLLPAAEIPAGQILEARMTIASGTRISKPGDRLNAVLVSPVLRNGQIIVPAGATVQGHVTSVAKLGFGMKNGRARMSVRFDQLTLPGGALLPIETVLVLVDTARERVDDMGQINGISPAISVSGALAINCWRLMVIEPSVGAAIWAVKFLFAPAPDPEIYYPVGTEVLLRVLNPVDIGSQSEIASVVAMRQNEEREVETLLNSLESLRVQQKSGKPGDRINLAIVGEATAVQRAFLAAGWRDSESRNAVSITKTYYTIVERRGYATAPMAPLTFWGSSAEFAFQKSLNSFSRRHHVRLWQAGVTTAGAPVWVGAATEDVDIAFSREAKRWNHAIDENIDNERTKIASDLLFTGCVEATSLMPVKAVDMPGIQTDGNVAVARLNMCESPRQMPVAPMREKKSSRFARAFKAFGYDIMRSNPVTMAFTNAHVPPQTFFGRQSPKKQRSLWAEQQATLLSQRAKAK